MVSASDLDNGDLRWQLGCLDHRKYRCIDSVVRSETHDAAETRAIIVVKPLSVSFEGGPGMCPARLRELNSADGAYLGKHSLTAS